MKFHLMAGTCLIALGLAIGSGAPATASIGPVVSVEGNVVANAVVSPGYVVVAKRGHKHRRGVSGLDVGDDDDDDDDQGEDDDDQGEDEQ